MPPGAGPLPCTTHVPSTGTQECSRPALLQRPPPNLSFSPHIVSARQSEHLCENTRSPHNTRHLWPTHGGPGAVLSMSHTRCHCILTSLRPVLLSAPLSGGTTEAQSSYVSCPQSHSVYKSEYIPLRLQTHQHTLSKSRLLSVALRTLPRSCSPRVGSIRAYFTQTPRLPTAWSGAGLGLGFPRQALWVI